MTCTKLKNDTALFWWDIGGMTAFQSTYAAQKGVTRSFQEMQSGNSSVGRAAAL